MSKIVEDIINEINEAQIHEGRELMLYEMRPIVEKHIAKIERSQGEWTKFTIGGGIVHYECSNCGHIEPYSPYFCPSCGAKMKK